jgi:hypothetical protein
MLTVPYLLRGLGDLDPNVGRQAATILLERYPSSPRATASPVSTKKPRPRAPKK